MKEQKRSEGMKNLDMQESLIQSHPSDEEYRKFPTVPTSEEHKKHIAPPTLSEYKEHISAPEPHEVGMSRFGHHYLSLLIIALVVVIVGVMVVWVYPESVTVKYVGGGRPLLFETTTMICESFEDNVCKRRDGNLFMKGEIIFIATRILPTIDEDLNVDLLFTADMVLPSGEIVKDIKKYNFKKIIPKNTFSSYLIEITPDEEDVFGEYTIRLRLIDNISRYREVVKKTFTLYNGAR